MTGGYPIVLVASATSQTGRAAIEHLVRAGKVNVRGLVRDPSSAAARQVQALGIQLVRGDFNDAASVEAALRGAHRAFLAGHADSDEGVAQQVAFLDAAHRAGVPVVRLSAANFLTAADSPTPWGRGHARVEEHIERSGNRRVLDLNPSWFLTNALSWAAEARARGTVTLPVQATSGPVVGAIDPRDIGEAAGAVLRLPEADFDRLLARRRLELRGPANVGLADVVAAVARHAGHKIEVVTVPDDEYVARLRSFGVPEPVARGVLHTWRLAFAADRPTRESTTGGRTDPDLLAVYAPRRTLDDWARENAAAFRRPTVLLASGAANTARHAARELLAAGSVHVRALVRRPDSDAARELAAAGAEVVRGDLDDPESVRAALRGVSRALLVSSAGEDSQFDREVAFLREAQAANLEVTVRVSTYSALIDPFAPGVYARAHGRIEQYIAATGARVVDLMPNWFFDNVLGSAGEAAATGAITMPTKGEHRSAHVHPADVGGAAAAVLLQPLDKLAPLLAKGRVEVNGPELVSLSQVVAELAKASGNPIRINTIPPEAFIKVLQSFGLSEYFAASFTHTYAVVGDNVELARPCSQELDPLLLSIGWKPRHNLASWVKAHAAAFAKKQ